MPTRNIKVKRNDPCTCGSGLKYKKCCLPKDAVISRKAQQKSQERLREDLEKNYGNQLVFHEQETEIKMSEIILDLVDEFLTDATSRHELDNIIRTTCMAWNLAVSLPKDQYQSEIQRFLSEMKLNEYESELQEFMTIIIEKKLERYPHVDRFIMDYELLGKPNNLHLNVASSFKPEEIDL